MKSIPKARKAGFKVGEICSYCELGRDAWYKYQKRNYSRKQKESIVLDLVSNERKDQSRIGTRKLYVKLKPTLEKGQLKIGRDKLFEILRSNNMLIKRKRATCKTTNSYHHFHKYKNLVKDMRVNRINQVWVSDITYIRTVKGFCYLALITDMYSRKIVGYDLSDSLELAGCLRAFKRAQRSARPAAGLVHHSDRGIQYCSNQYVAELEKHKVLLSMTEENHCYENAMAERVNGILKDEFYLDQCFTSTDHAKRAAENAINIYNSKRLHVSLGYKTPDSVFKKVA